jgi:hypothetical protein
MKWLRSHPPLGDAWENLTFVDTPSAGGTLAPHKAARADA